MSDAAPILAPEHDLSRGCLDSWKEVAADLKQFAANARTLVAAWRITAEDRYLAVLPLFHVHGLGNGVLCWLASGCLMRLAARFEHERAQALFEEFRPTLVFGVPTVYVRLLQLRGVGSIMGSIAGAVLMTYLDVKLQAIQDIPELGAILVKFSEEYMTMAGISNVAIIVYGLIMILIVLFEPLGIFGLWIRTKKYWKTYPF